MAEDQNELFKSLVINVQGRTFRPSQKTSFKQDFYVMERMELAKIDQMVAGFTKEGNAEEYAQQLLIAAYKSGKLFEILAGVMVEDGTKWTEEAALANAEFFEYLEEEEEKEQITQSLAAVVLGFFTHAGLSSRTSKSASGSPREGLTLHPGKKFTEAPTTTESGTV